MTDAMERQAGFEQITPAVAQEYLIHNIHNRDFRQAVHDMYVADILSGAWKVNGESVKFSRSGKLLDGQHRLTAVVTTGKTVETLVVRGLDDDTQETMDMGAKRKFSDVLKLRGEPSYTALASVVRAVAGWEKGERGNATASYSTARLLATLEKYPWLREAAHTGDRVARNASLPTSLAGLLYFLTVQIDPEDAEDFMQRLGSDLGHEAGQPVYELRKALEASRTMKGERSRRYMLAISIKAWNKYRAGESIGLLMFRAGGAKPEAFPLPL